MESLIATPEFWIKYQERVLTGYDQAADLGHQVGIVSERGRLLIFDQLILGGPGVVKRGIRAYSERYPRGVPGRPGAEAERIAALGEIFKSELPNNSAVIDTIISGPGSIRGINFNLSQLGVSDRAEMPLPR
jgi:hypothetical protein